MKLSTETLDRLDFAKGDGLVTVVVQDARTGAVLMVAHADAEAVRLTLESGEMYFRSRTRGLWHKGATSGNRQRVVELLADCDGDAILARVEAAGPACHTGAMSCFGDHQPDMLSALDDVIDDRAGAEAAGSYTGSLLSDRNRRLKKIGEEAAEFVVACADGDAPRATEEAADLMYHMLVALHAAGGSLDGVRTALAGRRAGRAERQVAPPQRGV